MRASLRDEVAVFLRERGPHRSTDIARHVCARRLDVDVVLASGGFTVAARPEGTETRSVYYDVSDLVPATRGGRSRADLLLDVLADGRLHTRDEIFAATGRFFHTNNAARELRGRGHVVEYDRSTDSYRLVSQDRAAA